MFHFIIYVYYSIIRELLKLNLPYWKKQNNVIDNVFNYTNNFMNWKINYNFDNNGSIEDNLNGFQNDKRIIMLSNHVNLCDIFTVLAMVRKTFPNHKIIGVTKKQFDSIPLFNKYLKNCSILLDSNKNKNNKHKEYLNDIYDNLIDKNEYEIINQIETLTKDCKSIVVLFPEGRIYSNESVKKSNDWCDKNSLEKYNHVLAPRYGALYKLLKYYDPSTVLINHIIYTDDLYNNKGKEYIDLLSGKLPKKSNMIIKDYSILIDYYNVSRLKNNENDSLKYFEACFNNVWYKVDNYINIMRLNSITKLLKN